MAINYQKVNWNTNSFVNPVSMNQMDNGIKSACDFADNFIDELEDFAQLEESTSFIDAGQPEVSVADLVDVKNRVGVLEPTVATHTTQINTLTNNLESKLSYSNNEIVCGTWINGKPIYRKVIAIGTLPNRSTKTTAHGINNIDLITKIYGFSKGTGGFTIILPCSTTNQSENVELYANNTNVYLSTGIDRSSYTTTCVILEYTKTTD